MTSSEVVLAVIRYLGRIAAALAVGLLVLTAYVLHLAGKSGSVDPVAVAAVGAISSLLSAVLGALGAMLVSTRTTGPEEVLEVTGTGGGPVETVEVQDEVVEPVARRR